MSGYRQAKCSDSFGAAQIRAVDSSVTYCFQTASSAFLHFASTVIKMWADLWLVQANGVLGFLGAVLIHTIDSSVTYWFQPASSAFLQSAITVIGHSSKEADLSKAVNRCFAFYTQKVTQTKVSKWQIAYHWFGKSEGLFKGCHG